MIRHPRHTRRCLALVLTTLVCAAGGTSSAWRGGGVPRAATSDGQTTFPDRWLQGFVRAVSGNSIVYPWAYPGQIKTLLSRTTDGRMAVEWDAEAVPPGPPDEPLTYLWHAGTASGYGAHRFTFSINGRQIATFTSGKTTADRDWTVRGEGGAALSYKTTRIGTFNELYGFMWLTAQADKGNIMVICGGPSERMTYGEMLGGAFGVLGLPLPPARKFSQKCYCTDWYDTSKPEALLHFQQKNFDDFRREMAKTVLGPPSPVIVPLMRYFIGPVFGRLIVRLL